MARIHIHEPIDEDIAMLNTRIGAPIPDSPAAPIIVRRHYVRHAINLQKLQETALAHGMPIVHCKAEMEIGRVETGSDRNPSREYRTSARIGREIL